MQKQINIFIIDRKLSKRCYISSDLKEIKRFKFIKKKNTSHSKIKQ